MGLSRARKKLSGSASRTALLGKSQLTNSASGSDLASTVFPALRTPVSHRIGSRAARLDPSD